MTEFQPPRDNLVRASFPGGEVRVAADGDPLHLFGHFARFNEWNLIDSVIEGRFLERVAPGAYTKTFAERVPKVLLNHGKDPQLGDKPIAVVRSLGEDETGPAYDTEILDGVPPLVVAGIRAGQYGASYRFSIPKGKDDWNRSATRSDHNPDGLPERTIREAIVYEFGPVTFPADPGATAGVRSLTDDYMFDRLTSDPERLASLIEAKQAKALAPEPAPATPIEASRSDPPEPPPPDTTVTTPDPPSGGSSDSRKETTVSEYVTRDDKASRVKELESSIAARAEEFDGVLPDDIQAADDAEVQEREALVRDIAAWDARKARVASFNGNVTRTEVGIAPIVHVKPTIEDIHDLAKIRSETRSREEFDTRVRENALRSIEGQRSAKDLNHLVDLVENHDEGMGDNGERASGALAQRVLVTGAPAYRRAFAKYLRHGNTMAFTPEEQRAAVAVVGTTTTGGYAVPYIFDPTMYHTGVWTAENPFRQACRTVEITNGNNWRTVTVGAITSAYATEAAAASENAPSFGQPTYTVQRAQAFATVSIETLEDRSDITSELTSVFAESKDTLEENKFAVGSGATVYPFGMFTDAAYTNQDTATNDVTAILDLQVLEGALPLRYRAKAAFFMNRSTLRQLMALDTTYRYFSGAGIQFVGNNQPNGNGGGNTGLQCLGYPVWEVPSAVSTLTTDGAIIVVLADPKSYIIVDRIGMNIEVVPTMLNGATPSFPTGERGIYVYWRNTAKPIAADAGRSLSVQ